MGSPMWVQRHKAQSHLLLSQVTNKKLEGKWSSWDANQCPVEWLHLQDRNQPARRPCYFLQVMLFLSLTFRLSFLCAIQPDSCNVLCHSTKIVLSLKEVKLTVIVLPFYFCFTCCSICDLPKANPIVSTKKITKY